MSYFLSTLGFQLLGSLEWYLNISSRLYFKSLTSSLQMICGRQCQCPARDPNVLHLTFSAPSFPFVGVSVLLFSVLSCAYGWKNVENTLHLVQASSPFKYDLIKWKGHFSRQMGDVTLDNSFCLSAPSTTIKMT